MCIRDRSFSSHIISENGGVFGYLLNNQLINLGNLIEVEITNYYKNILVLLLTATSLMVGTKALLPSKKILEKEVRTSKTIVKEDTPKKVKIISKDEEVQPIKKATPKVAEKKTIRVKSNREGYELPSLDLLKETDENNKNSIPDDLIQENRNKLSNALIEFCVEG